MHTYPYLRNLVQVVPGSSADLAGIHANDVIVQSGGKTVQGFLEVYYFKLVCILDYIFYNFMVNVFMKAIWV